MNFLYPGFLFGLFAIAIPIIIHLFNFRRYKKVYFTNVKFLKEIKQESESKSRIKQWLILAARILAVACLVLAFAQPFIPAANNTIKQGNKAISIYIDNSFSMEAVNKGGYLLDNAKRKAKEIAEVFKATDAFQLLTNDFEGKHQRLLSREEFTEAVEEVKVSPVFRTLSEVYTRQKDLLLSSTAADKRSFIISDFQISNVNLDEVKSDTSIATVLVPLVPNSSDNVYIDTCWFESPVQQTGIVQKLHVRIVNIGERSIENASLKLYINEKQISPASFSIETNAKTEVTLSYLVKETGIQNCRLEIDDHPVTFDDKLYFSYSVSKNIPTLVINGGQNRSEAYFTSLMRPDSLFSYTAMTEKSIDYSVFSKNNFIVLNDLSVITSGLAQELQKFLVNGGSLLIFPGANNDINSYNNFFAQCRVNLFGVEDTVNTKADKINFAQGLYSGVFEKQSENMDLPRVFSHYTTAVATRSNQEVIIRLLNGDPFLSQYNVNKGKLYVCSSPLDDDYNNFARHALFVPTIIKIAINSSQPRPLYLEVGGNQGMEINGVQLNKETPLHITSSNGKIDFIPEVKVTENSIMLYTRAQAKEAGNYFLQEEKRNLLGLSFNYQRKESNLKCYLPEELKKQVDESGFKNFSMIQPGEKSIAAGLAEISGGKKLWKLFIILALCFLAIETLLIRLLK
ncbi:MAG: BatA domain-containing protein [Bacteroidia bacterium]